MHMQMIANGWVNWWESIKWRKVLINSNAHHSKYLRIINVWNLVSAGGLFDIRESSSVDSSVDIKQETVFRRCVDTVNSLNILKNSTLSTQIERVPATDPFHTAKRGEH